MKTRIIDFGGKEINLSVIYRKPFYRSFKDEEGVPGYITAQGDHVHEDKIDFLKRWVSLREVSTSRGLEYQFASEKEIPLNADAIIIDICGACYTGKDTFRDAKFARMVK